MFLYIWCEVLPKLVQLKFNVIIFGPHQSQIRHRPMTHFHVWSKCGTESVTVRLHTLTFCLSKVDAAQILYLTSIYVLINSIIIFCTATVQSFAAETD